MLCIHTDMYNRKTIIKLHFCSSINAIFQEISTDIIPHKLCSCYYVINNNAIQFSFVKEIHCSSWLRAIPFQGLNLPPFQER